MRLKLSTCNLVLGKFSLRIFTELLPPVLNAVLPDWIYLPAVNNSQVVLGYNSAGFLLSYLTSTEPMLIGQ